MRRFLPGLTLLIAAPAAFAADREAEIASRSAAPISCRRRPARARAWPSHVILIDWVGDRVALIRDYRYVDYLASELHFDDDAP